MAPCELSTWPANPLQRLCVSNSSRCGAVRISKLADEPSAEIAFVESLSPWRRANLKARGRTLCGDCACRIALAVAPCEFQSSPTNPLRGSCVSNRSRCGAVRFFTWPANPLRRLCVSERSRCGAVRFFTWPTNPLRRLCVSERSRCGAVRIFYVADEPSAEIVRVGSLSLWCRANFLRGRRTLCGDCACRIALAVAPCEFQSSPTNPLRRLCVSNRSRCGVVRISKLADEPSAEIVRVESLSLWRRANFKARRRTLCGDCACRIALAVAPRNSMLADEPSADICACRIALAMVFAQFKYKSSTRSTLPQLRPENRKF